MIYDYYESKLEAERLRLSSLETVDVWLSALTASENSSQATART